MKILVTGAAGFIGFHVVQNLIKRGCNVVGIDNINDYYDHNLKYDRLLELGVKIEGKNARQKTYQPIQSSKNKNFTFLKLDLTDLKSMEKLFREQNFYTVINLAAQAGVRYSIKKPHVYAQSNLVGFLNVLECCRINKIKHLVYASSSSVYGNRSEVPFSEDERVDSPISLYAATKKSNELMAHSYCHLYNFKTTGLRFFTVYGPWGRPDMAPMLFANAINKGKSIDVYNEGDMQRDFTYVTDVVEGVVKVTLETKIEKVTKSEIYNIGNSKPVHLMEFISGIEKEMGKKVTKNFKPMQDGDVKITYADSSKLQNAFGYKPTTSLTVGLSKFIDWFKEYYML